MTKSMCINQFLHHYELVLLSSMDMW